LIVSAVVVAVANTGPALVVPIDTTQRGAVPKAVEKVIVQLVTAPVPVVTMAEKSVPTMVGVVPQAERTGVAGAVERI